MLKLKILKIIYYKLHDNYYPCQIFLIINTYYSKNIKINKPKSERTKASVATLTVTGSNLDICLGLVRLG